jgi:GTP cyclohydrolase III
MYPELSTGAILFLILMAVYAILQILLFFKLWAASNDIAVIKKRELTTDDELLTNYVAGNKNAVLTQLCKETVNDIVDEFENQGLMDVSVGYNGSPVTQSTANTKSFEAIRDRILKQAEPRFNAAGCEITAELRNLSAEQIKLL